MKLLCSYLNLLANPAKSLQPPLKGVRNVGWIKADPENAARVWRALHHFGAPVEALSITADDLAKPGLVVQLGLPPRRIDLLTRLSGIDFDDAYKSTFAANCAWGGLATGG
jgi:hypothetical protein